MLLRLKILALQIQWFFLKRKALKLSKRLDQVLDAIPTIPSENPWRARFENLAVQLMMGESLMREQGRALLHRVTLLQSQLRHHKIPDPFTVEIVPQSSGDPPVVQPTSDADTSLH